MHDRDSLQRFLFEHFAIRGELVRLNAAWHEILDRQDYPEQIQQILGEMVAASVLLSATLKFDGSLIMQVQSDGPLTLATVEATSERTLRGLAQWQGDVQDVDVSELILQGNLAITIDPKSGERYQGIVDVSCGDIPLALEDYMVRSQQLDTRLWLNADGDQSSGMLLQKMPDGQVSRSYSVPGSDYSNDSDADAWNRICQLANTIADEELKRLPFKEIIHRLFHEEDVRLFEAAPISFRCSCTQAKVRDMLKMLGYEEVKSILVAEGKVGVNCQFCNHYYEFDPVDVEEVFATEVPNKTPETRQ